MSTRDKDQFKIFVQSIFPETLVWEEFGIEDEIPIETALKSHGKWILYGSKKSVENFANQLKDEIGKEIVSVKYSLKPIQVTPNAPEGEYALVVYCDETNRDEVLTRLTNMGVNEVVWKYDWESFQGFINDPLSVLRVESLSPGRLEYLAGLVGLEINPEYLKKARDFRNWVEQTSDKFGEWAEMYEKGVDGEIILQKVREYFKKPIP